MVSPLSAKHLHDEAAAFAFVEARVWPDGPNCPHCGGVERISKMQGKATRQGLYKCYQCRKQFTVRIGTIFESSHVPLHIWLQAMCLITGSKKGISSNQLHRALGVTLKTAWFMSHRLREAMRFGSLLPMGGAGATVEADETYIGMKKGRVVRGGSGHKMRVVSLVCRDTGEARSIDANGLEPNQVANIVRANVDRESRLITDEARHYWKVGQEFAAHERIMHGAGQYVRGDVYTNTIEGYFSIFKRGMRGIYQFCGERHLHRYLAEFDFRYNNRAALGCNDEDRTEALLRGIVGKRLTYQTTRARA